MQDEGKLDGKVAIVTGAGSSGPGWGTGKAMSVLFAREGAKVVLVDRVEERAAETRSIIEDEGGEATVVVVDLTSTSGPDEVVAAAVERFGGIDVLVNNAAITAAEGILATTPERYAEVMAVNLTAPFMMTRAALPVMVAGGGGSVVFVTSIAAMRGLSDTENSGVVYATAKSGLVGLMTNLTDTFGRKGVRFNCIAPGIIDTPMRAAGVISAGLRPVADRHERPHGARFRGRRLGHRTSGAVRRRARRALHHRRAPARRRRHHRTVALKTEQDAGRKRRWTSCDSTDASSS